MKIVNITLSATGDWIDINTVAGIDVGTTLSVQCTGTTWIRIQESETEPTSEEEGKLLTNLSESSANATINGNPLRVWARSSKKGRQALLAVQPT